MRVPVVLWGHICREALASGPHLIAFQAAAAERRGSFWKEKNISGRHDQRKLSPLQARARAFPAAWH